MITNPNTILFINQVVRPIAEKARAFDLLVDNASTQWFAGINTTVPNLTSELVDDKRESEGVSRLNGADVNSLMTIIIAMKAASNAEIVQKPCVRALEVS